MATFPAVAANLMQTSPSPGTSAPASTGKSSDSFSSHLQAATEKQEASKGQTATAESQQVVSTRREKTVAETTAPTEDSAQEPLSTADSLTATETETTNAMEAGASSPRLQTGNKKQRSSAEQEVASEILSSQTAAKESIIGQMLAQLATPQEPQQEQASSFKQQTQQSQQAAEQTIELVSSTGEQSVTTPLTDQQILDNSWMQKKSMHSPLPTQLPGQLSTITQQTQQWNSGNFEQPETPPGSLPPNGISLTATNAQEMKTFQATTGATIIFNPQDGTVVTSNQNSQATGALLDDPESSLLFQNSNGQIIALQQSQDPVQSPPLGNSFSGNQTLHQRGNNLDFTSRYIHSHLNNDASTSMAAEQQNLNNEQSESELFNGGNQQLNTMQFGTGTLAQEGQSQFLSTAQLPFGVQLASNQLTPMATGSEATQTSYYQLGSGALVPDTAVVDQMIAHFSANKRLETSTVNLKLHPQELGELRLEIKVEQDNVKAHIVTQSPHSQEMLDRHLPKLREALEQQGLHLQDIEISVADGNTSFEEQFASNSGWQTSQQSMPGKQSHTDFSMELGEEAAEEEDVDTNFNAIA